MGKFIFSTNFMVVDTKKVPNAVSHKLVILWFPFLATSNPLMNCGNGMMKLSFGNLTIDLNIFNLQRQLDRFNDVTRYVIFLMMT